MALERKFLDRLLRRATRLRAHGSVPKSFIETEAADNLAQLAEDYFAGKKLIIWKGAGGRIVRGLLQG